MTAIQILEKLGADASLDPSQMSNNDKEQISQLVKNTAFFNASLVHSPAEEDDTEEDDTEEEVPEDKSVN
jgi:hypothetical protein